MLSAIQLAISTGAIAAVITSPLVYQYTSSWSRQLTGVTLADNGRPRVSGLVLHGAVIAFLIYYLLYSTAPQSVQIPPLAI